MPSRAATFLGDLGVEVSYRLSFMRSLYYISTLLPSSGRITYGGDVCSYDVIDSCSKVSVNGEAAVLSSGDNGIGIFFMVPQVGVSFW